MQLGSAGCVTRMSSPAGCMSCLQRYVLRLAPCAAQGAAGVQLVFCIAALFTSKEAVTATGWWSLEQEEAAAMSPLNMRRVIFMG